MRNFWLCFVPLFVAVDALGVLPMFMSMTEGAADRQIKKVVAQSVVTAAAVALAFLAIGTYVLELLGITVPDFMIAGGLLLLAISTRDLLAGDKKHRSVDMDSLGAVPIGVPLIVGPAVLTTTILLKNQHGYAPTVGALIVNIALAGVVFWTSGRLYRILGKAGAKIISKLASLLLAAIAVMMMRKGILLLAAGAF